MGRSICCCLGPVKVVRSTVEQIRDDFNEKYKKFYRIHGHQRDAHHHAGESQRLFAHRSTTAFSPAAKASSPRNARRHDFAALDWRCPCAGADAATNSRREVQERYRQTCRWPGNDADSRHARRGSVYVLGEVRNPGRYEMVAPTTAMHRSRWPGGRSMAEICAKSSSFAEPKIGGC